MTNKNKITNMRNIYLGCAAMLISVAGILHTYFGGGWSKSTGDAAKMYPRLVYAVFFLVGVYVVIMEIAGKVSLEPPAIANVKWWHVPLMLGVTIAFFEFSIRVGTIIGIFVYLIAMISMFDEDPKKNWKMNLIVAVGATIVLWIVFTKVLPIVTISQPLI